MPLSARFHHLHTGPSRTIHFRSSVVAVAMSLQQKLDTEGDLEVPTDIIWPNLPNMPGSSAGSSILYKVLSFFDIDVEASNKKDSDDDHLNVVASTPSLHSCVAGSKQPYSWAIVIDLGLMIVLCTCVPKHAIVDWTDDRYLLGTRGVRESSSQREWSTSQQATCTPSSWRS